MNPTHGDDEVFRAHSDRFGKIEASVTELRRDVFRAIKEFRDQDFVSLDTKVYELEQIVRTESATVAQIRSDLYNGDDPTHGLVHQLREFLAEARLTLASRWKRSDKIAAAGVAAVVLIAVLAWPCAKVYSFFSDLYQITQEWHQLHQSELDHKSLFEPPNKVYAKGTDQPQDSSLPSTYQPR